LLWWRRSGGPLLVYDAAQQFSDTNAKLLRLLLQPAPLNLCECNGRSLHGGYLGNRSVTVKGILIFGLSLVELYGPGTPPQGIWVNRDQVVSVREPARRDGFAAGTQCVITLANGNLVSSSEPCEMVVRRLR